MLLLTMGLLALTQPSGATALRPTPLCEYDHQIFGMGFEAFDQDLTGGWRALAEQKGCEEKAANIIRYYRQKYLSVMHLLYWHEAQIRAGVGDNTEAVALMEQSREPVDQDRSGWNPYVDATIAFLRHDRSGFLEAQNRLTRFQKPNDWPVDAEWPQNASVVAGLWNCFDKPYRAAYDASCRPKIKPPS